MLPPFPDELAAEQRLRRMRRWPLLLLLLMAVGFALSLYLSYSWTTWLNAFCEAAMVGALADWFAVTALFRHPLGVPIPHTAIVMRRKDAIGDNLARFVSQHFLTKQALEKHWRAMRPGSRLVKWLQEAKVREALVHHLLTSLHWGLSAIGEQPVRLFLERLSTNAMPADRIGLWVGRGLHRLIEDEQHQPVVSVMLEFLAKTVGRNENLIRHRIKQGSPWWMPGFIDDGIAKQMLTRVETLLLQMSTDEKHSLRRALNIQLYRMARELQQGKHRDALGRWWEGLIEQRELQDYGIGIWRKVTDEIGAQIEAGEGAWQAELEHWLKHWSLTLKDDAAMCEKLDEWLTNALVEVISAHQEEVSALISNTVAAWDTAETSKRIELQIGPDLQYIRINGTLVGGLVGLVLHALTAAII